MDTKHYTFKEGLCALVKPDGVHCLYRQGSEKDSYVVRYTFDYNEGAFMEKSVQDSLMVRFSILGKSRPSLILN